MCADYIAVDLLKSKLQQAHAARETAEAERDEARAELQVRARQVDNLAHVPLDIGNALKCPEDRDIREHCRLLAEHVAAGHECVRMANDVDRDAAHEAANKWRETLDALSAADGKEGRGSDGT